MKVCEVMTENVISVSPNTSIQDVATLMRDCNVGDVCVCNENNKLIGIITDRDIVIRALTQGYDPSKTSILSFMTPEVATVGPDTSLEDCARLMATEEVRRLPVTEDAKLLGIISLDDLAFCLQDIDLFLDTFRSISEYEQERSAYLKAA